MNKIRVLNFIYKGKDVSRADIAKETGISAPTVSRIVDSLIHNEKLAIETGLGESSGGRPPTIVKFNGENNFVIGIDWGRTHINGVMADLNARIIMELDIPSEIDNNFESDLNTITKLIELLINRSGVDKRLINGIGIAAAGYVNKESGIVEFSPNFRWRNANMMEPLKKKFNVPVIVDNVSRVVAIGEYLYGHRNNLQDFIFINIGFGIGSGIISDGKPFWGFDGFSGEFGHTRVEPLYGRSRICACGKTNCLECFCSGRGIADTMLSVMDNHPDSLIHMLCGGKKERVKTELIAQAAKAGDKLSTEIFQDSGTLLGISIANLANIINPGAIVLGGKVTLVGDVFITKINEAFNNEILRNTKRPIRLLTSELISHSAVQGAVSLILKEVLNLNLFGEKY